MPKTRQVVWEALSRRDAAFILGVSTRTVERYVARGMLHPFVLPSGHLRFPADQLTAIRDSTTRRQSPTRCDSTPAARR
jgi:predicted site-specific integrase-resolvase